ncbi:MAG: hypothetical protein ABI353_01215 [Isosphaeraceae bacterium]
MNSTTLTRVPLATFSFSLVFDGIIEDLTEELLNTLFEAGCDDAHVGVREGVLRITFDRESPSFRIALISAIADVERAGVGLELVRVEPA